LNEFAKPKKPGRNDPCPCGSGKKFKRCHGDLDLLDRSAAASPAIHGVLARAAAARVQRERQQGLGQPIISTYASGHRVVAVKNRLMQSKKWKTFFDFLGDYIKTVIGPEWGTAEIKKPFEDRHPILQWYHKIAEHQRTCVVEGSVSPISMTGAMAAYLHLAYDLYSLAHNAELQAKLIARLRDPNNFSGAWYEVQVAAILIRAGFKLEFEDEDDRRTSHCEFTATSQQTGKKFSVEAKKTEGKLRPMRLLHKALKKHANHRRIVFIDLNTPDPTIGTSEPKLLFNARASLRRYEQFDPASRELPEAYVFLTNCPWAHRIDALTPGSPVLVEGFRIAHFKDGVEFGSLHDALEARSQHIEMHDLMKSIRDHSEIPSTFDGELPEVAFGEISNRVLIGERCKVTIDNVEVSGTVTSATIAEPERDIVFSLQLDDGRSVISRRPMSEMEIDIWRRHPDTFFGVVGQRTNRVDTTIEMYDFLWSSYCQTPKDKLLGFLTNAPDFSELTQLDQPALARLYCERLATQIIAKKQTLISPAAPSS